jgi:hypothetical protein
MVANLYINDNWKRIGVRLSGGADSSILYYAICNHFKDRPDVEIYPLTMDTHYKWWYSRGAKIVIDRVAELTGKHPKEHVVHYYPHFTEYEFRNNTQRYVDGVDELQRLAILKYNLDAIYIGLTVNPPIADMKAYFNKNEHGLDVERAMEFINSRDCTRDIQEEREVMTVHYDVGDDEITAQQIIPFANADKSAVKQMYDHYNMIEDLYSVTYSCEEVPTNKTQPLVHCGHCFFCLERWWGFGRIL